MRDYLQYPHVFNGHRRGLGDRGLEGLLVCVVEGLEEHRVEGDYRVNFLGVRADVARDAPAVE